VDTVILWIVIGWLVVSVPAAMLVGSLLRSADERSAVLLAEGDGAWVLASALSALAEGQDRRKLVIGLTTGPGSAPSALFEACCLAANLVVEMPDDARARAAFDAVRQALHQVSAARRAVVVPAAS
jgi:hypothetical protein